jgi:hypothetical protein
MTPSKPQRAPVTRPAGGKQRSAPAIDEPRHQTGRRPEFAVEIWASPQLRERDPGRVRSLFEALEAGRGRVPRREPEPDPEPEPEP